MHVEGCTSTLLTHRYLVRQEGLNNEQVIYTMSIIQHSLTVAWVAIRIYTIDTWSKDVHRSKSISLFIKSDTVLSFHQILKTGRMNTVSIMTSDDVNKQ